MVVTGADGLLGSFLLEYHASNRELYPATRRGGFDILDRDSICRFIEGVAGETDTLLHLAAFTDTSAAHHQDGDREGDCYRINVNGTENVVDACNEFGLHLIHISTDFVFDGQSREPWTEEDTANPIEWYGKTKWMAEQVVRGKADRWTILRIAFPFLPEKGVRFDLVSKIRSKLAAGATLQLFGDQVITPTSAVDISNAVDLFAEKKPGEEIFHVVGNDAVTPWELGMMVAKVHGFEPSQIIKTSFADYIKIDPRPRQPCLAISNAKYSRFCRENGTPLPSDLRTALESDRCLAK